MSDATDRLGQLEVDVSRLRRTVRTQTALIVALVAAFTLAASGDPQELTLRKLAIADAAGTRRIEAGVNKDGAAVIQVLDSKGRARFEAATSPDGLDRKSTRLNSSHLGISYAVFCLKKKKINQHTRIEKPIRGRPIPTTSVSKTERQRDTECELHRSPRTKHDSS